MGIAKRTKRVYRARCWPPHDWPRSICIGKQLLAIACRPRNSGIHRCSIGQWVPPGLLHHQVAPCPRFFWPSFRDFSVAKNTYILITTISNYPYEIRIQHSGTQADPIRSVRSRNAFQRENYLARREEE